MHVFNLNLQRQLGWSTVATVGYAGSRGKNLWRNADVNVPVPTTLADGTLFYPPTAARPNTGFSSIEQKTSDGDSWYNAFVVRAAPHRAGPELPVLLHLVAQHRHHPGLDLLLRRDERHRLVLPGVRARLQQGPGRLQRTHNRVLNVIWDLPLGKDATGASRALLAGLAARGDRPVPLGQPLTLFVGANRSRSRWSPSIGPGQGFDRPCLAPGHTTESAVRGTPDQWFDPAAFVLQPAGTYGDLGRGAFYGPDLRTVDLALSKHFPWKRSGQPATRAAGRGLQRLQPRELRHPEPQAFAGLADNEEPLATFGRIRTTVTSARQIQLGLRVQF